jgi:hypothetical protein
MEKPKVMGISKAAIPGAYNIMIDEKQLKNVNDFNCLGSMINDARFNHSVAYLTAGL